jgi:hypothetical protein
MSRLSREVRGGRQVPGLLNLLLVGRGGGASNEFGDGVKHPVPIPKREWSECETLMLQ